MKIDDLITKLNHLKDNGYTEVIINDHEHGVEANIEVQGLMVNLEEDIVYDNYKLGTLKFEPEFVQGSLNGNVYKDLGGEYITKDSWDGCIGCEFLDASGNCTGKLQLNICMNDDVIWIKKH